MSNYSRKINLKERPREKAFFVVPFFRYLRVFFLAAVLTVAFVSILNTILPRSLYQGANSNRSDIRQIQKSLSTEIVEHEQSKTVPVTDIQSLNKIQSNISLEEIRKAIIDGSYSKLSILRPEILGNSLIKETSLLPEVKNLLLSRLLFLMAAEDWNSWREILSLSSKSRTPARVFVDNVGTVNFQLGRYLETAGLLFSSLYLKTSRGSIFSTEQALYGLLQQSDLLFSSKAPKAISTRVFLDTLITDDPTFINHLEKLKTSLILNYNKKEPNEIETQLILLKTIPSEYLNAEVIKIYQEILNHVTQKISPRFREEIRSHYFSPEFVKGIVKHHSPLEPSFAKLYEVVIVDFLKNGDLVKAKSNFLHLNSFSEDSPTLNSIQAQIDSAEEKITVASVDENENEVNGEKSAKPGIKLFPTAQAESSSIASTIQYYSFFGALIIFVLILVKRFRVILLSLLMLFGAFIARRYRKIMGIEEKDENLINELDASIKAGKTVPMKNLPRNRQVNKKAANF